MLYVARSNIVLAQHVCNGLAPLHRPIMDQHPQSHFHVFPHLHTSKQITQQPLEVNPDQVGSPGWAMQ